MQAGTFAVVLFCMQRLESRLSFQENIMKLGRSLITSALTTIALATMAQFAHADSEFAAAWGPDVGTSAPLLAATDQDGKQQTLDTLKGSNGLLFIFNRSVDW